MKFALFTHVPWPEGTDPQRVFEETIVEFEYAEELGFHSAWMAEHHFSRYGLGSSSMVLAAAIAQRTKTIRLGSAVLLPSIQNPVRLAEDTATVDLLSGGRLDVGLGRGTNGYEFTGFNVPWEESQGRYREGVAMIKGLWSNQEFSFEGEYFSADRLSLVPPPVQKPHPPLYLAATLTQATLEFVSTMGHPLMIGVVLDTVNAVELCQRFLSMSQNAGHDIPMSSIPFFRYFWVAETEEQARKDAAEGLNWTLDMLQWRRTFTNGSEVYHRLDDWRSTRTEAPVTAEYLMENRAIVGTPEQCVAKIKDLQRQGIEYFGCNFSFGGMEHSRLIKSMKLFAEEVMLHFS